MGDIVPSRRFSPEKTQGLLKPVIVCCPCPAIEEKAISLNKLLAMGLSCFKPNRRSMQIENCLYDVLCKLPNNPVVRGFDVLFHPDYKVDVLSILVSVCKRKNFMAVWPGRFENGKLIYAEESYRDYKIFDVKAYDITCVV